MNKDVSVTYFLMRKEPVAYDYKKDEEVYGWMEVPNSHRREPYPKEEMEWRKMWKQFKRTVIEEEVTY